MTTTNKRNVLPYLVGTLMGYWVKILIYSKNKSEYDQEIPQSHTADQPTVQ